MRKIGLLLFSSFLFTQVGKSQNNWCGTDRATELWYQTMTPQEAEAHKALRKKNFIKAKSGNNKSGHVLTVPVVVHVLHDQCDGNISYEQIVDGIKVLNEDFRRMNSDTGDTRSIFKPHAADVEIEFKLARIDPQNNCTEGIVRVETEWANNVPQGNYQPHKEVSHWPESKYFNVWLVNSIGESDGNSYVAGYAQFPGTGQWKYYGMVVRNDHWGRVGTSRHDGRTATHEVGHCLNLLHTFQPSNWPWNEACDAGSNCSNGGDLICDTPPVRSATQGCNKTQNTCSNDVGAGSPYQSDVVDQIENYMSYDNCTNMFTQDQTDEMRGVLLSGQSPYWQLINLVSQNNLIATGTDSAYVPQDCAPIADYCLYNTTICEGGQIEFTDLSYNGEATSRSWSFPGGTPATSTDSVVTVQYDVAGTYDVTLTVSNSKGSNDKKTEQIVHVDTRTSDKSFYKYEEDFENEDEYDTLWSVVQGPVNLWTRTNAASYSGDHSIRVLNLIESTTQIITPSYNMTEVFLPKMYFQVAYAYRTSTSSDQLKIYYIDNCGGSWSLMALIPSFQLQSVTGTRGGSWAPADQSEWISLEASISNSIANEENVRFMFEFKGGDGNNIYIDDINILSLTSIEENELNNDIDIYPNPASSILYVRSEKMEEMNRIAIQNLSGQLVFEEQITDSGSVFELNVSELNPGIYFVQITDRSGNQVVEKVVIQ